MDRSYGMTWVCMMTVSAVFAALALAAPETVMTLYTDKTVIRAIGVKYLKIVGAAYPMQVCSMAMSALLRATERVRIPMVASLASVAVNIVLNWVLIYGHFGLPAMGIEGAAIATTAAAGVNVALIYFLAWVGKYPFLFHLRGHFRWRKGQIGIYFKKCFPIILNELLLGIGNMIINVTLGRQPEEVIAALAVFRTLEGLIIGFFAGFSSAASVLVGKCVGAGELETAYQRAKRLVYLCSGIIFVAGLALIGLRRPILTTMGLEGASYEAGVRFLVIYVFVALIRMGNWIMNDTYRASGDAVTGTVLEIVFMYVLVVPAVLVTGFVLHLPYWAIFICCYADEPIRYVMMQITLYSGRWVRPVTAVGAAALPEFRKRRDRKTRKNV